MLNRRPCRGYSNIVLGRKIGGLAPEVMNLDYMTWPNPGSGCVRSASYNRLLSSTAFLTRECTLITERNPLEAQAEFHGVGCEGQHRLRGFVKFSTV